MKKTYKKPMISFEELSLDMPIAANCAPNTFDIVAELKELDYFGDSDSCFWLNVDEYLDIKYGDDKICYYTLNTQLFTS